MKDMPMENTGSQEVIVLAPGGGPTLTFMDAKIAYKVSSTETGGAWSLLEHTLPPHFAGMPLHWHKVTQQGFYVLEGKVSFQVGSQVFSAEPGAFISVPTQTLHKFSNQQDGSARLLEIIVPGGCESFLKELVALTQVEPDLLLKPHRLLDVYQRYDTFIPDEL
jgi:mannose-6-phosphate isomerase-like protein (cupin superfamily)